MKTKERLLVLTLYTFAIINRCTHIKTCWCMCMLDSTFIWWHAC